MKLRSFFGVVVHTLQIEKNLRLLDFEWLLSDKDTNFSQKLR